MTLATETISERRTMGLTPEQMQLRSDKLGASDAPAVLGVDPYRSAADVFLEKTGRCEPFAGNEHTRRGQYREPGLVMFAQDETGIEFFPAPTFLHPSNLLLATPDRLSKSMTDGIEAKSTGLVDGWGEPGTDQIPDKVLVQVAQQFLCVPTLQIIWVPVELIGFRSIDFEIFRVERETPAVGELMAAVESAGLDFMRKYVLADREPDDFRPSLEVLRRVKRVPNKIVPVADELVAGFVAARDARLQAQKEEEKRQSYLLAALSDAEGGTYEGGQFTYMETHRKECVQKASVYRTLRGPWTKQAKKGA